ncbi:hypothetical protein DRQ26_05285 [bacterium]|nr:MAG: hypothetical protein DRQ26_05285 [bacterium]
MKMKILDGGEEVFETELDNQLMDMLFIRFQHQVYWFNKLLQKSDSDKKLKKLVDKFNEELQRWSP